MKKIISSLSLMALCTITSCTNSNDEISESNHISQDKVAKIVNLVSNDIDANNRINVIIFTVGIGRASQNCIHGWGFCNFHWGAKSTSKNVEELEVQQRISANNTKYFEIHAGSEIPNDVPNGDFDLTVDEDMSTQVVNEDNTTTTVTLKKGIYHFDRSIGEYGGFKIYLQ